MNKKLQMVMRFERAPRRYLGKNYLKISEETKKIKMQRISRFLTFVETHSNIHEFRLITRHHWGHYVQDRRRAGISPETLRKEAYTIKAFIEAVNKIDGLKEPFHINPQRILKQPSAK